MTAISAVEPHLIAHLNLGTFEGFNFRNQSAIWPNLSTDEVLNWNHDTQGEAEFWPSGDRPEVALIFRHRTAVSASDLLKLDELLQQLGGDSLQNWLRIHHALNGSGQDIACLTVEMIEDQYVHIFEGDSFIDLRRQAAYELFELFYPEEYQVWEKSHCDGLDFDTDRFLDSPSWAVEEITLGSIKVLIISAQ